LTLFVFHFQPFLHFKRTMASKRNVSRFEKKYTNGGSHFDSTPARGMTPLRSYLLLGTYLIAAIILGSSLHYQLPEPKTHRGISPLVDAGEFSEYNAIETLTYLGDTLGYRKLFFHCCIVRICMSVLPLGY
jgi:hypothetical protein